VTITVANPKGGSGKTPTTLLLAGALGQSSWWRGRGLGQQRAARQHAPAYARHDARSTVTDLLQAMTMLTQPDARPPATSAPICGNQVSGQYDVLTSATTTYAQIEAKDFDQIHRLLSRFYKVLVIDTGNNEGSSNWREAMKASDVLVIPIKWKSLSCAAAVQMLEELDHQGPDAQRLIRRASSRSATAPVMSTRTSKSNCARTSSRAPPLSSTSRPIRTSPPKVRSTTPPSSRPPAAQHWSWQRRSPSRSRSR